MSNLLSSLFSGSHRLPSTIAKGFLVAVAVALFANQVLVQRALRAAVELTEESMELRLELSRIECGISFLSLARDQNHPEVEQELAKLIDLRVENQARLAVILRERWLFQQEWLPLFAR